MRKLLFMALFVSYGLDPLASHAIGVGYRPQKQSRHAETGPSGRFLDPEGKPIPLQTDEEVMEFLRTARVISLTPIGRGVTGARQILLEKAGLRMVAIFRDFRVEESRELPTGTRVEFRDDYIFECAAYELSKLLGLDNVPPVVKREIRGVKGTLQVWMVGAITEKERKTKNLSPPDERQLRRQWEVMRIFDNLIFNDDRNSGNILYDRRGKLWMIDHTRSFRTYAELPYPAAIQSCERKLWKRLQKLETAVLKARLEKYLRPAQIKALIKRKQALVEHIQEMIAERGEDAALFTEAQ